MKAIKTVSGVVTRPVHAAASVAGRAIGLSLGATRAGFRTTGRVVEWAADRGMSPEDTPVSPVRVTPSPATPTPVARPAADDAAPPAEKAPEPVSRPTPPAKKTAKAKTKGTRSSVPTPAEVKPAIDRSAPLEVEHPEVEPLEDDGPEEVLTASGIPAAGVGVNPATGEPNRYDTEPEPLLDPGTVKAVRSETEVLRRGAEETPSADGGTKAAPEPGKENTKKRPQNG